jgi:haloalkane dehalogenase
MGQIKALRTPDDRFRNLPDYPYEPHYIESLPGYEGLRAHYLDLGPRDAKKTFLCLHGEPTWSYLYRRMIPAMLQSGARVVAPDFFGFGRSDKPIEDSAYTYHFHRNYLLRFTEALDLKNLTLVVQDWGGMLGLTLPVDAGFRPRLARLIVMNTVLPIGRPLKPHFYEWRSLVRNTPDLPVGAWIRDSTPFLSDQEQAAYDAPFPDIHYKAGARTFPDLVMVEQGMEGIPESKAALEFWSKEWSGPSFMAIGAKDPNLGLETMRALHANIKGCPEPLIVEDADHFVQEWGLQVIEAALKVFGDL